MGLWLKEIPMISGRLVGWWNIWFPLIPRCSFRAAYIQIYSYSHLDVPGMCFFFSLVETDRRHERKNMSLQLGLISACLYVVIPFHEAFLNRREPYWPTRISWHFMGSQGEFDVKINPILQAWTQQTHCSKPTNKHQIFLATHWRPIRHGF